MVKRINNEIDVQAVTARVHVSGLDYVLEVILNPSTGYPTTSVVTWKKTYSGAKPVCADWSGEAVPYYHQAWGWVPICDASSSTCEVTAM